MEQLTQYLTNVTQADRLNTDDPPQDDLAYALANATLYSVIATLQSVFQPYMSEASFVEALKKRVNAPQAADFTSPEQFLQLGMDTLGPLPYIAIAIYIGILHGPDDPNLSTLVAQNFGYAYYMFFFALVVSQVIPAPPLGTGQALGVLQSGLSPEHIHIFEQLLGRFEGGSSTQPEQSG